MARQRVTPQIGETSSSAEDAKSELDRKLVRSSAWLAVSYGGAQVVTFVVTSVLAHLIAPSAFGLVATAAVVIASIAYLQESGLGMALIHRRTDVDVAAGSVLVFSVLASLVLYAASFVLAPLVARLFGEPGLTSVLRVLTLLVIPRAVGMVPAVLIERELAFGSRARGELAGSIVQACTAVPLAAAGAGVWSLVVGQLVGETVQTAIYWVVAPFRPSPRLFDWKILRQLSRYGRHVLGANILFVIGGNVDTAVVARLLGATDVGFYNIAWRLSNLPATGIAYIIGRVMFPAYSTLQDNRPAFREAFLTNVRRVSIVSLPVGVGILLAAGPIVTGIFGERWSAAVGPLQILAVFGLVRSVSGATGSVFQAAGRPQLVTLLNIWHLLVLVGALVALTPPFGLEGAAGAMTIAAVASLLPAYRLALRILELPFRELAANLRRPVLCSVPLALVLLAIRVPIEDLSAAAQLAVLVACSALVYVVSALTFVRGELASIRAAFRSP